MCQKTFDVVGAPLGTSLWESSQRILIQSASWIYRGEETWKQTRREDGEGKEREGKGGQKREGREQLGRGVKSPLAILQFNNHYCMWAKGNLTSSGSPCSQEGGGAVLGDEVGIFPLL